YLSKALWPFDLAVFYPLPAYWPSWQIILGISVVLGTSIVAFCLGRKFPFLATGWFWFVGMLVPVIGLVQVGSQSMADRYTYVPLIGLFIIATWVAYEIQIRSRLSKRFVALIAVVALAACAMRTRDQIN